MFRSFIAVSAAAMLFAGAAAAQTNGTQVAQGSAPTKTVSTMTAETFGQNLVDAITATVDQHGKDPISQLQALLETSIQSVFVQGNVEPVTARSGVTLAQTKLAASNLYCKSPKGDATTACEAVGKALELAIAAAEAANQAPGAIGGTSNTLGAPPSAGAGGGGGGVTHPPVATVV